MPYTAHLGFLTPHNVFMWSNSDLPASQLYDDGDNFPVEVRKEVQPHQPIFEERKLIDLYSAWNNLRNRSSDHVSTQIAATAHPAVT